MFPKLRRYGNGPPGVSMGDEDWWVIRDGRGHVVGGAVVRSIGSNHPVLIDVAVDPARQGEGWASRLYQALQQRGFDMEAGSAASLAHCWMTLDGYLFMLGRRLEADPDAEIKMVATASVCPGCGELSTSGGPVG